MSKLELLQHVDDQDDHIQSLQAALRLVEVSKGIHASAKDSGGDPAVQMPSHTQDNDNEEVGENVKKLRAKVAILESYANDISMAHEEANQQNKKLMMALRTLQEEFLSLSDQHAEAQGEINKLQDANKSLIGIKSVTVGSHVRTRSSYPHVLGDEIAHEYDNPAVMIHQGPLMSVQKEIQRLRAKKTAVDEGVAYTSIPASLPAVKTEGRKEPQCFSIATKPHTDDEGSGSGVASAPSAYKSECRSLNACPTPTWYG